MAESFSCRVEADRRARYYSGTAVDGNCRLLWTAACSDALAERYAPSYLCFQLMSMYVWLVPSLCRFACRRCTEVGL